jgi:predicted ATPase
MLPLLGSVEALHPAHTFLSTMRACTISTDSLRELEDPDLGQRLEPNGRNAASVLRALDDVSRRELLAVVALAVPGVQSITAANRARKLTLSFEKAVGESDSLSFDAAQMSDGTLRLLGILLALYQPEQPSVLSVEEPETALHFAATQAMLETFEQRAAQTQIVLTTHSADVIDAIALDDVRLVRSEDGVSVIAPVAPESAELVRNELFTAGELMRAENLRGAGESLVA